MLKIINEHLLTRTVDVCAVCSTFNQAQYIHECIGGMLRQTGDYSYMILIHDDASTDGTDAIVEDYARAYPELITALIEEENQLSKGNSATDIVSPLINSQYVAICEGDDWWIDPNKIANQLEVFRNDASCTLCVHEALAYDDSDGEFLEPIRPCANSRYYSIEEIILGDGGFFGTCSFMMSADLYPLRGSFRGWGIGDYPRAIQCATEGRVFYIAKPMAVYRVNADGSWSRRQLASPSKQASGKRKIISGLNRFDKQYGYQFHPQVERIVERYKYQIAVVEGDVASMFGKGCRQERRAMSALNLAKDFAKCLFPTLYRMHLKRKYS